MFDDHSPIFRQIADRIRSDILNGTIAEGEKVMSTNQFAVFYRINPATAAKAFQDLVDEGVLYKQRGIGMFVSDGAVATLHRRYRDQFSAEFIQPMLERARDLGIGIDDIVAIVRTEGKGS